jgi:hypothetical protein
MSGLEVHLDEAALLARLRGSDVRRGVRREAEAVDGSLGIYLAHPAGVAVEAADGALQRAASARGLQLQAGEPEQI